MKKLNKGLSLLMTFAVFISIISVFATTSLAFAGGVQDRLQAVQSDFPNGAYFTTDGRNGSPRDLISILKARGLSTVGFDQSTTCVGFAKYVWAKVFGHNITDGYRINVAGQESNNLRAGLPSTWENAKVGDLVYFYESVSDPKMNHAAIVWEINGNTISLVDCNYNHTNQVKYYSVTCGQSGWPKSYCRIFRSNNYDEINGTTSTNKLPSEISILLTNYPVGVLEQGNSYPLRGTITSNYNITSVRGSILNSSGREVMGYTQNPNTKSFNIRGSAVDMNLKFGSLSAGSYTLKFTAENSAGTSKSWSRSFTVKGTAEPQTYTITFDARGGSVSPSSVTLTVGQSYKNLPTPTYPGFEFVGWYIDTKTQYGNATTLVRDIGAFKLTEDATIYAEWREAQPEHVACTTHTKGAFQFYEASHPHYNYYKCSVCGETFTDGSTSYMESCATCNPPKESTVTPWSGWSTTPVQATATRQVETRTVKVSDAKTQYRYGRYVSNGHDCWCATYLQKLGYGQGRLDYSEWTTTRYSTSGKDWSCGYCNGNHQYVDHTSSNGTDWWKEYKSPSGQSYYWEETQTVPAVYETQYRYRDRVN